MITLSDYKLIEPVHKGHRTCVYRGIRTSDNLPVVIKTLTSGHPSRSEIERLEYEYNVTKSLTASEIIRAYDFINAGYNRALILEDFGGISLYHYIKLARHDLGIFLGIAVAIVKAVDVIHRERIIHKDIKPQNIFINKISKEIKITDFSNASRMIKETPVVMNPELIEGTLAYVSPEQTGRMNRSIDFRSDYYSLGVTLYELFTGVLPFACSDPMELIHAHIAMQAISVDRVNSTIPPIVSRIIMKLLSKNAEDRYKSAAGIRADLEECLKRLTKYNVVDDFPLGVKDRSDSFIIPEKLYGRNRHLEALYGEYQRVVHGEFRMILFSGPPGIGKSTLIKEIHKPLIKEKGYFISGKFDQYKRTFPYLAFIQAIQDLVRQILTESEEQLENWKKIIIAALENDASILINIFPDIELIIGHHAMTEKISAVELKDRFLAVFLKFIKVFAQRNKPLVLFLDDLQWIDDSSLQLLHALMMNHGVSGLLIIGTYRDADIEYNEQALRLFEYLEKRKDFWTRVELGTLNLEDINSLVSDTLSVQPADSMILSELIVAKTGGNPFFVKEFLINLYQNKYIQCNECGTWQFDIRRISIANMTDNVVDLLIDRYKDLPIDVKELLQTVSCLGSMFSLHELFLFFDTIKVQIFDSIQLAVENGILIKSNDQLCFSHDRIQEAVYSTLENERREQIHYLIARYLFNKSVVKKNDDDIFNLAHHYNCAANLLTTEEEKETLSRINLKAGIRAKQSIAYEAANDFMKKALGSLPADSWRSVYDLALSIHSEMVELGYLRGNSEEAERHFKIVKNKVANPIDAVRVYEVIIYHKTALNNMEEAFRLGLEALAMLGMKMPRKPGPALLLKEIITARINLINKKIEDLVDNKDLTDPKQASIARLLMCCSEASYITSPDYLPLIILKLLNISLKYGNSIYAPYAYASYGVILSAFLNNIDRGHKFGKLSLLVLEKYNAEEFKCKVYFLFGNLINHWKNHLRTDLEYLEESYVSGFQMRDPSFASYAVNHYLFHRFFMGEKLDVMKDLFSQYTAIMERFQQLNPTQSFKLWHQLVVNICDDAADKCLIKGEICDEDVLIPEKIKTKELTCLGFYTVGKMFLYYLYGDYKKAIEVARSGEKNLKGVLGMIFIPEFYYLYSLAMLAHSLTAGKTEYMRMLGKIDSNQKKMKRWMSHAPENYTHKYLLVEAERQARKGVMIDALRLYERSIDHAGRNGFLHDEAIANERCARFLTFNGFDKTAITYYNNSFLLYDSWGARIKVDLFKSEFPWLQSYSVSPLKIEFKNNELVRSLDLNTMMKASYAISSEIEISKLNKTLIRIILENAGAQRGLMMLENEGEMYIQAECIAENSRVVMFETLPIRSYGKAPLSVINYVRRTKESVVLNDSSGEGRFKDDPYIREHQARSILCVPLVKQQELKGIIYLENNLVIGAFPPERQETVKLLSTQAAISIENALLFERSTENERELEHNYEEMQAQYEEMERMNEELVRTYNNLDQANKNLARESGLLEIFRQFAETSGQGFGMCDLDGSITYANTALCHMMGAKNADDLLGRKVWHYIPLSLVKEKRDLILRALEGRGEWTDELPIRNPETNAEIPSIQNVFILRDKNNKPVCYGAIVTDLTDMKKAEATLRESEERYRLLVETMKEGLCMLDVNGCVTYINNSLSLLLGYDINDVVGRPVFEFMDDENKKSLMRRFDLIQQGDNNPYELNLLRKDGMRISTIVSPQAIYNAEGAYIASFGVVTDITEKKKAEEAHEVMQRQLLQSQKMEAIGNLAGGVAHDFNNLLTAILGYADLLMNQIDSRDERYDLVSEIIKAADRSAVLTRQLLAFSRKQIIEAAVVDLNKIVTDMEKLLRRLIGEDIQFVIELDHTIRNIYADRSHIEQVLMNLVVNARDAMPSGGNLTIKTSDIVITDATAVAEKYLSRGRYVCLVVEDSGIGMDEELMQNIFEPFFTTKDTGKGTGLGLSVVYGIIKQHGGYINVSSRPKEGSSFRIYLPEVESDQAVMPDEAFRKKYRRGNGERILLVEDQLEVRKFTSMALRQYGYIVFEAESIRDALDVFHKEEGHIDILFCDVVLPDGNGLEVVKNLMEQKKQLKIIMTSGYMEQRSQFNEIKDKGYTFLQKPYSLDTLLHAVGNVSL